MQLQCLWLTRLTSTCVAMLQQMGLVPTSSPSAGQKQAKQALAPANPLQAPAAIPQRPRPAASASMAARPAKKARTVASSIQHHAVAEGDTTGPWPAQEEPIEQSLALGTDTGAVGPDLGVKEAAIEEFDFGSSFGSVSLTSIMPDVHLPIAPRAQDFPAAEPVVPQLGQPSEDAPLAVATGSGASPPPTTALRTYAQRAIRQAEPKKEERQLSFPPFAGGSTDLSMSQSSQAGGLSREEQARAFLAEEDLEIDDDDNVAALLAIGFKSKTRFIRSIKISSAEDRTRLLAPLRQSMGSTDFLIFQGYLKGLGLEV